MAVAARRVGAESRQRRAHLSLVEPPARRRAARPRASSAELMRWRSAFRTYVLVVAVLAIIACGRVSLTSAAAEATLASSRLQQDIDAERLVADKLEVSRSSLTTPSRIRDIAGTSLQMVEPGKVEYLDLAAAEAAAKSAEAGGNAGGLRDVIAKAMDLAAGEAQLLLVGDVGLASSR